ncbi:MAG TPA: hypothetical protein VGD29_29745 [Actinoplanes sp.]
MSRLRASAVRYPRDRRLDDDQQVVFVTADPGSPTARAFRALL